jgi:Fe-S cluster assembly iron-binding protein IscA
MIHLTEKAATEVKRLIQAQSLPKKPVSVSVSGEVDVPASRIH